MKTVARSTPSGLPGTVLWLGLVLSGVWLPGLPIDAQESTLPGRLARLDGGLHTLAIDELVGFLIGQASVPEAEPVAGELRILGSVRGLNAELALALLDANDLELVVSDQGTELWSRRLAPGTDTRSVTTVLPIEHIDAGEARATVLELLRVRNRRLGRVDGRSDGRLEQEPRVVRVHEPPALVLRSPRAGAERIRPLLAALDAGARDGGLLLRCLELRHVTPFELMAEFERLYPVPYCIFGAREARPDELDIPVFPPERTADGPTLRLLLHAESSRFVIEGSDPQEVDLARRLVEFLDTPHVSLRSSLRLYRSRHRHVGALIQELRAEFGRLIRRQVSRPPMDGERVVVPLRLLPHPATEHIILQAPADAMLNLLATLEELDHAPETADDDESTPDEDGPDTTDAGTTTP